MPTVIYQQNNQPVHPMRSLLLPFYLAATCHACQIFVVLRHEVYPKFVARVMEMSRQQAPVAAATATKTTTKLDKSKKGSWSGTSKPASPVPIEKQKVSWSESDEVSKAVRAELAKCYY